MRPIYWGGIRCLTNFLLLYPKTHTAVRKPLKIQMMPSLFSDKQSFVFRHRTIVFMKSFERRAKAEGPAKVLNKELNVVMVWDTDYGYRRKFFEAAKTRYFDYIRVLGESSSRASASELGGLMMQMMLDDRPSLRMRNFFVSASEILSEGPPTIRKNMGIELSNLPDDEIIARLFSDDRWKELRGKNEVTTYNQSKRVTIFIAVLCFWKDASTSGSAPASWESLPELKEDLYPGISPEAQKRQRLHSLITRAPRAIAFKLEDMNRLRKEQLSTSALSGTIEGFKLGGSNDFILYLSGPIEVRLLFVARSDSSLEELDALYPKGASVTVKKHFRLEGRCVVDNPGSVEITSCFPTTMELCQRTSSELRSLGNEHFLRKECLAAVELYNLSISKADNERDKLLALANAAECYLELENFFLALQNAEKALALADATENVPTLVKLLTRKGRALHGMLQYKDAVQAYKLALSRCSNGEAYNDQRAHLIKLMDKSEERDISDDLHRYLSRGCKSDDAPPFLDFVGPVELAPREEGGIGLFATEDIKPGKIVLLSNALGYVRDMYAEHAAVDVYVKLLRAALTSRRSWLQLHYLWSQIFDEDNARIPPMQVFKPNSDIDWTKKRNVETDKIRQILEHNFKLGFLGGVWTLPGFIAHSCRGNLCVVQVGPAKIFRANAKIPKGEELTYSYAPSLEMLPVALRQEFLNWCRCWRCTTEMLYRRCGGPYESLCLRYLKHLREYRRVTEVNPKNRRQFMVEQELVQVAIDSEEILKHMTNSKLNKTVLRISFAPAYLLYFLYQDSAHPKVADEFCNDFMHATATNLESLETLTAGFLPTAFYPTMTKEEEKWKTVADMAIDFCFIMRYGASMTKSVTLKFLKWLQSDEPDKARRA
ncbi:hypothetical protein SELMODRAFT_403606 [Selaginella moellendorffii]|uniref:SET domain-containing protein n=1 Tax=Selaginella moellendorffii TaxID=88036 RepID=D8QRY2_SELML|nr:hypothetical protein SELMODRAFT_403606 [Selaginella moellendorffii]